MSDLSKLLKSWKPRFNINISLPFGGAKKKIEIKRPIGRPPKKPNRWYRWIVDLLISFLQKL